MKVLVEDVKEIQDERLLITIRLKSGRSLTFDSKLYEDGDMMAFIGKEIDVLLQGTRVPLAELRIMPNNITPFEMENEYTRIDLAKELEKVHPHTATGYKVGRRDLIAEGTFIPKYFPDSKWNRKKSVGVAELLGSS